MNNNELEIDEEPKKQLFIFGKDVSEIPCFRSSFLYGMGGGFVGGIAAFLKTSRPQFSTHIGMGSFFVTTFAYWFTCRYQWSKLKFEYSQLETAMKKQALYEGTAIEEEAIKQASAKNVV